MSSETIAGAHRGSQGTAGETALMRYSIIGWACLGLAACALSVTVFGQWIFSDEAFRAVSLTAADAMGPGRVQLIRIVEGISTAVALWALFHYLLRPWIRTGTPTIQGLLLLGALVSYVLDTTVNYADYLMAWNKHAVNFGTWASFFPGHTGPTQYAEAMLWGPPMYLYFGVALGSIQLWVFDSLKRRFGAGLALALIGSYLVAFVGDLVAESLIIRTEAYAWPNTVGWATVWSGTQFQFPLYESMLVGFYSTGYMLLIRSEREGGTAFTERGLEHVKAPWQLALRFLAATGFATLMTLIYFGGFYLISQVADTRVELPPYLMYTDPGWSPAP